RASQAGVDAGHRIWRRGDVRAERGSGAAGGGSKVKEARAAEGRGALVEDLRAMIDAGRAFGRHPLWLGIQGGRLPRSALRPFAVQFFLQVREFPRAVSALHSSCPDIEQRIELAESLYEEETGRISGCNVSHPELFIRFGEAVGVPRDAMVGGVPLPATVALIDWFEQSTKQLPFIEGA